MTKRFRLNFLHGKNIIVPKSNVAILKISQPGILDLRRRHAFSDEIILNFNYAKIQYNSSTSFNTCYLQYNKISIEPATNL